MEIQSQKKQNSSDFNELPIGKTNNNQFIDQYPPDFDPNQINDVQPRKPDPLEKRIKSNVFKIKKQAIEQLYSLVQNDANIYQQQVFSKNTIAFLKDSNASFQQTVVKIILIYMQKANKIPSSVKSKQLISTIFQKCLINDKNIQLISNSYEILFWLFDHNEQETLFSVINELIMSKNPKISTNTIQFLTVFLNNYGATKLQNLQMFYKNLGLLGQQARNNLKTALTNLYKQLYRWIGDISFEMFDMGQVKQQIKKFSKGYIKQTIKPKRNQKGKQSLLTQQNNNQLQEIQCQIQNTQPVDILSHYDQKWFTNVLKLQKWKQKKQCLDQFIRKSRVPKIQPKQTFYLINFIKQLIADNNINLLQAGFKIMNNLCKGLQKHFYKSCRALITTIFNKLKDKKKQTAQEALATLENMTKCIGIEQMMEDIKIGLNDKAPNMRINTLKVLEIFIKAYKGQKGKSIQANLKTLVGKLSQLASDGNAQVRQYTFNVLCKLKCIYGIGFFGDKLKKLPANKVSALEKQIVPGYEMIQSTIFTTTLEKIPKKPLNLKNQISAQQYSQECIENKIIQKPKKDNNILHNNNNKPNKKLNVLPAKERKQIINNINMNANKESNVDIIQNYLGKRNINSSSLTNNNAQQNYFDGNVFATGSQAFHSTIVKTNPFIQQQQHQQHQHHQQHHHQQQQQNNPPNQSSLSSSLIIRPKIDRLNNQKQNPWPIETSAKHITQLFKTMQSLGEPLSIISQPINLNKQHFKIMSSLQKQFMNEWSDILVKWIFWKIQSQKINGVLQIIKFALKFIQECNLEQCQIVILRGAMMNCLQQNGQSITKSICSMNHAINKKNQQFMMSNFRFWLNSLTDPYVPLKQILNILQQCFPQQIGTQLISFGRIPRISKNTQFMKFLRQKFGDSALTLYGFNLNIQNNQKVYKIQSLIPKIDQKQRDFYLCLFEKNTSDQFVKALEQLIYNQTQPEKRIEVHLKIMFIISVPYLKGQISFLNAYQYYSHLNRNIIYLQFNSNLLVLTTFLSYFLLDIDPKKDKDQFKQVFQIINRVLLSLMDYSSPKHMFQVLFIIIELHLKNEQSPRTIMMLQKCMARVVKSNLIKEDRQTAKEIIRFFLKSINQLIVKCSLGQNSVIIEKFEPVVNQMKYLSNTLKNCVQQLLNQNQYQISPVFKKFLQRCIINKIGNSNSLNNSSQKKETPALQTINQNHSISNYLNKTLNPFISDIMRKKFSEQIQNNINNN